jgi:hypothetical protein
VNDPRRDTGAAAHNSQRAKLLGARGGVPRTPARYRPPPFRVEREEVVGLARKVDIVLADANPAKAGRLRQGLSQISGGSWPVIPIGVKADSFGVLKRAGV